jgi:hypothetical protein
VQTQINAKQATVSGVNDTEIGYLDGVTSAIQTQINARVPNSTITTKGDLIVGTGNGTYVRQGVGTNGQLLAANSAQADGVEWVNAPSSGWVSLASGSISGTSLNITSIPGGYNYLVFAIYNLTNSYGDGTTMRFNSDSNANRYTFGYVQSTSVGGSSDSNRFDLPNGNSIGSFLVQIYNYTSTVSKSKTVLGTYGGATSSYGGMFSGNYYQPTASAITSINLATSTGWTAGGTYVLYGAN